MPESNYTKDDFLAVMEELKAVFPNDFNIKGLKIESDSTAEYPFFIFSEPHAYQYDFYRNIKNFPGLNVKRGESYNNKSEPFYDTINSIVEISDLQQLKQFIANAKSYKITDALVKISDFNQYNNFQDQIELVNSVFNRENAPTRFIPNRFNSETLNYVIAANDPRWESLEKRLKGAAAAKAIQYTIEVELGSSMKVIKIHEVNLKTLARAKDKLDNPSKSDLSDLQSVIDVLKRIYPENPLIQDLTVINGNDSFTRPFPHIRTSKSHNLSENNLNEYLNDLIGVDVMTKKIDGETQLILDIENTSKLKTELMYILIDKIAPTALNDFKQIESKILELQKFVKNSPFESPVWFGDKPQHMKDTLKLIEDMKTLKNNFLKSPMQQNDLDDFNKKVATQIGNYEKSLSERKIDLSAPQMGKSEINILNKLQKTKTFLDDLLPTEKDTKAANLVKGLVEKLNTLQDKFDKSSMSKKDFDIFKKNSIHAIEDSLSSSPLDKIKSLFQKIKNFLTNDNSHYLQKINHGEQHKEISKDLKNKLADLHETSKASETIAFKNR